MKKETREKFERVSNDFNGICFDSSKDFLGSEIVEIGVEDGKGYKDTYSNEMYSPGRSKSKYSGGVGERERPKSRSGKDIEVDKGYVNSWMSHTHEEIKHH